MTRSPLAGIGMMLLGVFLFSANDVLGKWLVSTYSVGQVLALRSVAALVVLAPFLAGGDLRALLRPDRPGIQVARVLCGTLETAAFYWAVRSLPLADVMTYWLAGPVYVVGLSALLLGERVGLRRWVAAGAGFAGVVVALGPTVSAPSLPVLVSVAGSLSFALLALTTRYLRETPAAVLVAYQTAGALLLGLLLSPTGWVPPSPRDLALLLLLGIVSMAAHVCVTRALALAPASVVVPYDYTFLVWAIVFGYVVFGDVPSPTMLAGAAIVCGAGIYLATLERQEPR